VWLHPSDHRPGDDALNGAAWWRHREQRL